jgi:alkaline phosphatase
MASKLQRMASVLLCVLAASACSGQAGTDPVSANNQQAATGQVAIAEGNETWARGREEVAARLARPHRPQRARNVVLFIVDGMSIPTITAARIFVGQQEGLLGSDHRLAVDRFDSTALVRTYDNERQVADSASTASALMTGFKTHSGSISIASGASLENCAEDVVHPATLLERAEQRGLATGIVSTARLTHATPATTYAHSPTRRWENDADMFEAAVAAGCRDIAAQFLAFDHGDGIEVTLGGGMRNFRPTEAGGERTDGRDLSREWQDLDRDLVTTSGELQALDDQSTRPVLGLFTDSHMSYEADRDPSEEPSLAEMSRFALDRLARDEDGYFLMIEAGRVDHAHHATNAYRAMTDMAAFETAVQAVLERVDLDDTLVVVTADHSHTFTISGYPARGNPILGLVREPVPYQTDLEPELALAADGRPYTSVGYQTGPNLRSDEGDALTDAQVQDPEYRQETAIPLSSETHSGADVALYASGPRSHYFTGSMEQNTVFHLIMEAWDWPVEGAVIGDD